MQYLAHWIAKPETTTGITRQVSEASAGKSLIILSFATAVGRIMKRQKIYLPFLMVVPALIALLAVVLEPFFTNWVKGRETLLPLATLLILSVLLHPRLRHMLMIVLCYGVAFLAFRDVVRLNHVHLPPLLDYDFVDILRPVALLLVAGLSMTAAVAESVRPGTVWARRCYFGAAALYFIGLGVINYAWHGSWQSIVLCGTGITSLVGCVYAHRIVDEEEEDEQFAASDEVLQQAREAAHYASLQAKEWRDNAPVPGVQPPPHLSSH